MASSNSTVGFWKPFLAGAVASASLILLTPQVWKTVKKQTKATKKKNEEENRSALVAVVASSTDNDGEPLFDSVKLDQRMLRKAEGALQKRTTRLTVVVERCTNDFNYSAILRTAEALGVQNVWIICPPILREDMADRLQTMGGKVIQTTTDETESRRMHHLFARKATEWLTVREFDSTRECLDELRKTNHTVWATDLSQQAVCLTKEDLRKIRHPQQEQDHNVLPEKLAIVFGTEAVGCTQEMLDGADLRVYLPLRGFADSLNLSVATALVLHQLFLLDPTLEGTMTETERRTLREAWFAKLVVNRLLTSAQKKQRTKLRTTVEQLHDLQRKHENDPNSLDDTQLQKIERFKPKEQELLQFEESILAKAKQVVQPLVDSPPDPITDMRRADEHRTWFGGKGTKAKYEGVWDNMPATTSYNTKDGFSTAAYFRSQLEE